MTKQERITGLIQNEATKFAEKDRPWLDALTEQQLEAMEPTPPAAPTPMTNEQILARAKELGLVEKQEPQPAINAEDRAALDFGKRAMKERRDALTQAIQANAEGVYTAEELGAMSLDGLEKLARVAKAPVSYEGRPAPVLGNADPAAGGGKMPEAYKPPTINFQQVN